VKVTREKSKIFSQAIDKVRRSQLILSDVMWKKKKAFKRKSRIVLEAKTWNINLISLDIESIIPDKSQIQFPSSLCPKTKDNRAATFLIQ
jgi:hypothetical protein